MFKRNYCIAFKHIGRILKLTILQVFETKLSVPTELLQF